MNLPKEDRGEFVVVFSSGPREGGGYSEGTNDGARDGKSSGYSDWTDNRWVYCTEKEWNLAGNETPTE